MIGAGYNSATKRFDIIRGSVTVSGKPALLVMKEFVELQTLRYPIELIVPLKFWGQEPLKPVELQFSGSAPILFGTPLGEACGVRNGTNRAAEEFGGVWDWRAWEGGVRSIDRRRFGGGNGALGGLGFSFLQMILQLLLFGQSGEVVLKYLQRGFGRFAISPKVQQHAGNNRAVRLNAEPFGFVAEGHNGIEGDVRGAGFGGQFALFENLVGTIVADAADVAIVRGHDVVEQLELGVPPIHDVQVIGGQMLTEDGFVVGFAAVFTGGQGPLATAHHDPVGTVCAIARRDLPCRSAWSATSLPRPESGPAAACHPPV